MRDEKAQCSYQIICSDFTSNPVYFSLVMFAQGQFFEHFYRSSKINAMEHNSNQLLKELEKEPNAKLPARTIGEFMNQNDTSISILNSNFEIIRLNPYFIKLQTKNKIVKIEIPLDGIQEGRYHRT